MQKIDDLTEEFEELRNWLKDLKVWWIVGELEYRVMSEKFPHVFNWGTWAEYLQTLLKRIDLLDFIKKCDEELKTATQIKQKKIITKN
jgi:hypothetical protein